MSEHALWTMAIAGLVGVLCAVLGVWLVLQRVSMLGDAISHAVLPGLVVGFLLFGTRAAAPMLFGALAAGILTVVLTKVISSATLLREDASMGVVFTGLFAVGVLLITRYARQVDLDPGCVLYGQLEFAALDTFEIGGFAIPRAIQSVVFGVVLVGAALTLFRKEIALASFDPGLARALGFRPDALILCLMALVAVASVVSFESVGSILVVAMLIGPAATAQMLTRRLRPMFAIAVVVALLSAVLGYWLAAALNTSVAGMIATVIGAFYGVAVLVSPAGGLVPSAWGRWAQTRRIEDEDLLAALYRLREGGVPSTATSLHGVLGAAFRTSALARLLNSGLARTSGESITLKSAGVERAQALVRRHRLLESIYVEELGVAATDVHPPVDRAEHYLSSVGQDELERLEGSRGLDPHGKPIPHSDEASRDSGS